VAPRADAAIGGNVVRVADGLGGSNGSPGSIGGPLDEAPTWQPRWTRHLVAICGGLGVGLLAYRYGVLPFVIENPVARSFLWVGVAFVAAARQSFRTGRGHVASGILTGERIVAGLGAAALSFGLAFVVAPPLGYLRLEPRPFPGFVLQLPAVGELKATPSGYAQGRKQLERPGGISAVIQVNWEAGGLFDDDDAAALGRMFATVFEGDASAVRVETRAVASAPAISKTWLVHAGSREIWMSVGICGGRRIVLTTTSEAWGLERLHARVLGSLRCQPDPAQETTLGDVPVVFDTDAGWSRIPSTSDQLQLTDGNVVVMARSIVGRGEPGEEDKFAELMSASVPGLHLGARDGDHWPAEFTIEGDKHRGWVRILDCPDRSQRLWLMSFGESSASAESLKFLRAARCRRADETPQHWPDLRAQ
jgi:hypothetical protein